MKRLCLAFAAVLLAGCGGGGGGDAASAMSMPDQVPLPPPGDTFTSALIVLVRSAPETTEPAGVDGTEAAAPEGGEPVAVE